MNSEHNKILKKLAELCEKHPEQRFGQILFNYTMIGTRTKVSGVVKDPFHYTDEKFVENMEE